SLIAGGYLGCQPSVSTPPSANPPAAPPTEDIRVGVSRFCGACHAVPPADTFPRSAWKDEVERGYLFFQQSGMPLQAPPIEAVIQYYQERAPEELPPADIQRVASPPPVQFERQDFSGPQHPDLPAISNVNLVHLYDKRRLDVLATDMRR